MQYHQITAFHYAVYATGHGYAKFFCQFKNDNLLTLEQIKFITFCRMQDNAQVFWQDGPPLLLTEIVIRSV